MTPPRQGLRGPPGPDPLVAAARERAWERTLAWATWLDAGGRVTVEDGCAVVRLPDVPADLRTDLQNPLGAIPTAWCLRGCLLARGLPGHVLVEWPDGWRWDPEVALEALISRLRRSPARHPRRHATKLREVQ